MASENQVLIAVLSQLNVTGINYKTLAEEIGAPTPAAARMKWTRYWKKLQESKCAGNSPHKPGGITKAAKKPGVKIGTPSKKTKGSVAGKVAGVESEESMMETGIGTGTEEDDLPVTPPPKRLPKRKAKENAMGVVQKYKEAIGSSEEDGEEEGEEEPLVGGEDEGEDFKIEMDDLEV